VFQPGRSAAQGATPRVPAAGLLQEPGPAPEDPRHHLLPSHQGPGASTCRRSCTRGVLRDDRGPAEGVRRAHPRVHDHPGDGELVAAPLAITRLLRFQQVTSGFLPVEGEEPYRDIGKENPRLELVREICEDIPHPAIIWCRFNRTVDKVMEMLGDRAVRYDGQVSATTRGRRPRTSSRTRGKPSSSSPRSRRPARASRSTAPAPSSTSRTPSTWPAASSRRTGAHRIGQEHPVNYIDLCALGTVDERIITALLEKYDIANQITGDSRTTATARSSSEKSASRLIVNNRSRPSNCWPISKASSPVSARNERCTRAPSRRGPRKCSRRVLIFPWRRLASSARRSPRSALPRKLNGPDAPHCVSDYRQGVAKQPANLLWRSLDEWLECSRNASAPHACPHV
jgi:hypothetical protein